MAELNGKKVVFSAHLHVLGTDTSDATATAADIKRGKTAYAQNAKITGTFDGVDTSDANATAADIATGKTAYVNGAKITGTAESEETIYSELLSAEWGTPVYTVTKGTITGFASQSVETATVFIKKDTAPEDDSDYDYYCDGDGTDTDTIPASFTASKLYIWRSTDGEASITSPVTQALSEPYDSAYELTLSGNITLSLRISDEDY